MDYARSDEIDRVEFVSTSGVYPTLTYLSGDIFTAFPNLRVLRVTANLADLDRADFSDAMNLATLDLRSNELPSLESLDLEGNEIDAIEDGALNLPALEYLYLGENKLRTLSNGVFERLPALKFPRISNNRLEHIGRSLYGLLSVTTVKLNGNRLQDVDLAEFAKMPQLGGLTLSLR